jgi:hypothetical protein
MEFILEANSRESVRHETIGLMTNISDGKSTFVGVIEDVSRNGLRVSQVPANFDDTVDRCYSLVHGPHDNFAIALQPRWVRQTNRGMYKMIGFEIEAPPEKWTAFVEGMKDDMVQCCFLVPTRAAA